MIRQMASANPQSGAPRIHGELLKLGISISERSVSRLMSRRRPPPSQTWRTFLANHVDEIASVDLFTVPTVTFRIYNLDVHHWSSRGFVRLVTVGLCARARIRQRIATGSCRFGGFAVHTQTSNPMHLGPLCQQGTSVAIQSMNEVR